ncbi:sodium- and chloride-dependent GABA transporter 1-like isoform X1 [Macrobrachium rosenbergii]|uniref:sodium- and chloride-dependent GABA transporter 1-like isoform X1 n=1 Tax=Macrobrachium rosenbergii TaxID=79674 RepID=UPI0034D661AF
MLRVFSRCINSSPRVPVSDQQIQAENGCELDNTEINRRRRAPLEINSPDNRTVINLGVQTAQDGITRNSLQPALELSNNGVQGKEGDSLNPTGESTPTSGSQLNGRTVLRRSTEEGEDPRQDLPATERSVKAWPLRSIQQHAKRTYQGIKKWVVRLFLYLVGPVPTRQRWNSTSDSIMGLLAVIVGLGNVWRFPYYCYKYKGVNFLIAYGVALLVIGFPLGVVDISIGQYLSLGPTNAYASMAPLFSGLGWAMVASSAIISIYYAVILGWTITYIHHSFRKDFTFAPNQTGNNYEKAKAFFRNEVNHSNDDKAFEIQSQLVLVLGLAWLFVMVSLVRGIRSSSKVMYITNTFPYVVMMLLLAYSYLTYNVDVWNKSFDLFFSPKEVDGTELLTWEIWVDAASQVLFSFGYVSGNIMTLASYNDLRQNTLWTVLFIILWDTAASLLCGCVVFVSLSKLTSDLNVNIEALFNPNHTAGRMGVEVVFIAYPAFLADVKSPIWFVLFFLMVLTLGINSLIGLVETVTTALFDNFTHLRSRYFPNVCAVIFMMFLLGLLMCTSTRFYIVECMLSYSCHLSLPLLGISHTFLVCYLFVPCHMGSVKHRNTRPGGPKTPGMYIALGWTLSISPFLLVPAFAIYKYIQLKDKDWRVLLRPTQDFLPEYLREHSNRPDMFILAEY